MTSPLRFRIPLFLQLPGILALSTKFLPTVMNLLKKLADEGQRPAGPPPSELAPKGHVAFGNGTRSGTSSSDASSSLTSPDAAAEYSE